MHVRSGRATHRGRAFHVALIALLASAGCREQKATIQLGPLLPEVDAGADLLPLPEGAVPCKEDATCDDGIECTRDRCADGRYCAHAADSSVCSDGQFCNGQELCDARSGCVPGAPRECNDSDVCTVDRCDEAGKRCAHEPRDFDGDGESDWHCGGGTDCDDFDPTRAQQLEEICTDQIDNDCDDQIDESRCGTPAHDRCDDALDVSAGGSHVVELGGSSADYAPACAKEMSRDVAFTFELQAAADVTLTARGMLSDGTEETAVVAVRRECSDAATELDCNRNFPGQVRLRALSPGRYFAIVSSTLAAQVWLDVQIDAPTEPPTHTSCEAALPITDDAQVFGDFVDVGDHDQLACGFVGASDLFYTFTLDRPRDVEIAASSAGGERMNFAVRTQCDDADTTLRCVSDAPAWARMYQLPPGRYFIVLESSPSREIDFSLELRFTEPSEPPPGQGCYTPIELPLDTVVQGSLANQQDLVDVQCGCSDGNCNLFRPDIVYRVVLDEPADLGLEIEAGDIPLSYDLRRTCDDRESQVSCSPAQVRGGRIRDLDAGTYYLTMEAAAPGNFTLQLTALPRSAPVTVQSNETCGTAWEIPQEGGLFAGDTLMMLNDYEARCGGGASSKDAVFRLDLAQRSEVSVALDATFDSVLYRYTDLGAGPTAETCNYAGESICNDDVMAGITDSNLSAEVLDPGSYYYVVDGFSRDNAGRYLLEVDIVALDP